MATDSRVWWRDVCCGHFSAPFPCLFHKGLSSPRQPVIWHHKGFYLAVRWLMSLEPWQPIKCYNLIVLFPAIPHPPYPPRPHCTKKRIGDWGGRGNKIDVKRKGLWLHFEIKQINKSTKFKKRQMQQRCSYLYLWALSCKDMPANDVSSRISKSTKWSIYHVHQNTLRGRKCQFTSSCNFNLIVTKISLKYH